MFGPRSVSVDRLEKPIRPWWKKKRWRAAILLWVALPILYVAASGPVLYCTYRQWIPRSVFNAAYRPLARSTLHYGPASDALIDYGFWWQKLAQVHEHREYVLEIGCMRELMSD